MAVVTASVPSPRRTGGLPSQAANYEWRTFLGVEAHLYRRSQLAAAWPPMLTPWCEETRPVPLRHELAGISSTRLPAPTSATSCVECGHLLRAANREALRAQA